MFYTRAGVKIQRALVVLTAALLFLVTTVLGYRFVVDSAHAAFVDDVRLEFVSSPTNPLRGGSFEYKVKVSNNSATETYQESTMTLNFLDTSRSTQISCSDATGQAACPASYYSYSAIDNRIFNITLPPASSLTFRFVGKYDGASQQAIATARIYSDSGHETAATPQLVTDLGSINATLEHQILPIDTNLDDGKLEYKIYVKNIGSQDVAGAKLDYSIAMPRYLSYSYLYGVLFPEVALSTGTPPDITDWQLSERDAGGVTELYVPTEENSGIEYDLPVGKELVFGVEIYVDDQETDGCGTPADARFTSSFNAKLIAAYPAQTAAVLHTPLALPACPSNEAVINATTAIGDIDLTPPAIYDDKFNFSLTYSNPVDSNYTVQRIKDATVKFALSGSIMGEDRHFWGARIKISCDASSTVPCPYWASNTAYGVYSYDGFKVLEGQRLHIPAGGFLKLNVEVEQLEFCGTITVNSEIIPQNSVYQNVSTASSVNAPVAEVRCAYVAVTEAKFSEPEVPGGQSSKLHITVQNKGNLASGEAKVSLTHNIWAEMAINGFTDVTCIEASSGATCPTGIVFAAHDPKTYEITIPDIPVGVSYKLELLYQAKTTSYSNFNHNGNVWEVNAQAIGAAQYIQNRPVTVANRITFYDNPQLECETGPTYDWNGPPVGPPGEPVPWPQPQPVPIDGEPIPQPQPWPDWDTPIDEGLSFVSAIAVAGVGVVKTQDTVDPATVHPSCLVSIPPPVLSDPCGPDNAYYPDQPNGNAKVQITYSNNNKKVTYTIEAPYYFTDGTRTKVYEAVDSNEPCDDVVIPDPPLQNDPCGPDNATWIVPAESDKLTWHLNSDNELIVSTKLGYSFIGGATTHNYGKATDANEPCAEIEVPDLPFVGGIGSEHVYFAGFTVLLAGSIVLGSMLLIRRMGW